jgi:hypothetical protein
MIHEQPSTRLSKAETDPSRTHAHVLTHRQHFRLVSVSNGWKTHTDESVKQPKATSPDDHGPRPLLTHHTYSHTRRMDEPRGIQLAWVTQASYLPTYLPTYLPNSQTNPALVLPAKMLGRSQRPT